MVKDTIKLVIWDMDDTFWNGTISEGSIEVIEKNIEIVRQLTDRGIVNSICSKNEYDVVEKKLKEIGTFEYFIFPTVNWNAKGPQIKQLIEKCQLRPENVLFIDDNSHNLQEACYYCPNINVEGPEFLKELLNNEFLQGKEDKNHSRLNKYKILEEKQKNRDEYATNEEFLYASKIRVQICKDCSEEKERIYELIHRTNQLNYTKKRISLEQLAELLSDRECESAYIKVEDDYGHYGIVGFYACRKNKLEHFLFSCRILGMGVEQWVYAKLDYPEIEIEQPISVELKQGVCPRWINWKKEQENTRKAVQNGRRILIRGGCDLMQMEFYLQSVSNNITCEFNHLNFHREHTFLTRGILEYDEQTKRELVESIPFLYRDCFQSQMFSEKHDVIVYSVLMDYAQKVYCLRDKPEIKVAYGVFNTNIPREMIEKWSENEKEYFTKYLVEFSGGDIGSRI